MLLVDKLELIGLIGYIYGNVRYKKKFIFGIYIIRLKNGLERSILIRFGEVMVWDWKF